MDELIELREASRAAVDHDLRSERVSNSGEEHKESTHRSTTLQGQLAAKHHSPPRARHPHRARIPCPRHDRQSEPTDSQIADQSRPDSQRVRTGGCGRRMASSDRPRISLATTCRRVCQSSSPRERRVPVQVGEEGQSRKVDIHKQTHGSPSESDKRARNSLEAVEAAKVGSSIEGIPKHSNEDWMLEAAFQWLTHFTIERLLKLSISDGAKEEDIGCHKEYCRVGLSFPSSLPTWLTLPSLSGRLSSPVGPVEEPSNRHGLHQPRGCAAIGVSLPSVLPSSRS